MALVVETPVLTNVTLLMCHHMLRVTGEYTMPGSTGHDGRMAFSWPAFTSAMIDRRVERVELGF